MKYNWQIIGFAVGSGLFTNGFVSSGVPVYAALALVSSLALIITGFRSVIESAVEELKKK